MGVCMGGGGVVELIDSTTANLRWAPKEGCTVCLGPTPPGFLHRLPGRWCNVTPIPLWAHIGGLLLDNLYRGGGMGQANSIRLNDIAPLSKQIKREHWPCYSRGFVFIGSPNIQCFLY